MFKKEKKMVIGLTYDLRQEYLDQGYSEEETAELDHPATIEALEKTLLSLGFKVKRIGHFKNLITLLQQGQRWDMVFNICEGLYGMGREALVPALLEAYQIPYVFSDPLVLALSLHKGMTKKVIRDSHIATPDFLVVEKIEDLKNLHLSFPLFAKPVAEGTGKGIHSHSKILNIKDLTLVCQDLLNQFKQPVLVEEFLPGREFTIGMVGCQEDSQVLGVIEVVLKKEAENDVYSYFNKENFEKLVTYQVPEPFVVQSCSQLARAIWQVLGCRDGGRIDVRMDQQGVPHFLEVNPLAGLRPHYSDLPILCQLNNISYQEMLKKIMNSALKRYGIKEIV